MVFPIPGFVEAKAIDVIDHFQVAPDLLRRVFADGVDWRNEYPKLHPQNPSVHSALGIE
jgi:hypothetical protein